MKYNIPVPYVYEWHALCTRHLFQEVKEDDNFRRDNTRFNWKRAPKFLRDIRDKLNIKIDWHYGERRVQNKEPFLREMFPYIIEMSYSQYEQIIPWKSDSTTFTYWARHGFHGIYVIFNQDYNSRSDRTFFWGFTNEEDMLLFKLRWL